VEGITTVKVPRLILVFFFGLIVSLAPLKAQVVIDKIQTSQANPGAKTTLILRGKGFLKMEHIKVRIDNFDVSVLGDPIIESDSVAKIKILIPSWIQPQTSHKITVRVSGKGFARWTQLKPLAIEEQNPPEMNRTLQPVPLPNLQPQPFAKIEILPQAGEATTAGVPTLINFDTTSVNSPVTRIINIHNAGTAPLKLTNPELPEAFKLLTAFPLNLQPGRTAPLVVQLKAETANSFNGTLQFNSNVDDQNPFFLRLQGTVSPLPLPLPPSPWPFGTYTNIIILIVTIIAFIFVSLFLAKNIFFKIKPVKDLGSQQIQQNKLIKSDSVLQIEPFFDYGEPVVEVKGPLIREKKKTNRMDLFRERAKLSLK